MRVPQLQSLTIKNILPGLPERGKIKIGKKGELRPSKNGGQYRLPMKIDHFLITTLEKNPADDNFIVDEKMHQILGGEEITEIPVYLIYDDIALNFPSRYTAYKGKDLVGVSDGENRHWYNSTTKEWVSDLWPVDFDLFSQQSEVKWRINATLSVMIDKADAVGGVWKLRTTSYNAVQGILSSLTLIKSCTGGALAGIPLMLTLRPKTVSTPDGGGMVAYIPGLEFRGSMAALRDTGLKIMLENQKHFIMLERIEDEARKLICASNATDFNDIDDRSDLAIGHEAEINQEQNKKPGVQEASFENLPPPVEVAGAAESEVTGGAAPAEEKPKEEKPKASKVAATKAEPAKAEPKAEPTKAEPAKSEPAKAEPTKTEPPKIQPAKAEPAKAAPAKAAPAKEDLF